MTISVLIVVSDINNGIRFYGFLLRNVNSSM